MALEKGIKELFMCEVKTNYVNYMKSSYYNIDDSFPYNSIEDINDEVDKIKIIDNYKELKYFLYKKDNEKKLKVTGSLEKNIRKLRKYSFEKELESYYYGLLEIKQEKKYGIIIDDTWRKIQILGLNKGNYIEDRKNMRFTLEFDIAFETENAVKIIEYGEEPEEREEAEEERECYIIKKGDQLGKIAKSKYGAASKWRTEICKENGEPFTDWEAERLPIGTKIYFR